LHKIVASRLIHVSPHLEGRHIGYLSIEICCIIHYCIKWGRTDIL